MQRDVKYDAVIVGSGPNGFSAAITLARAGYRVLVVEGKDTIGGGMRSAELTLPGFVHDVCSSIHPLARGAPALRRLPLHRYGLRWIQPPVPLAHPLDDGTAVLLEKSVADTAAGLGRDGGAYRRLMQPLTEGWAGLAPSVLGPLAWPKHPLALARFGLLALLPARAMARALFRTEQARALFGGMAGHALVPLDAPATAGFGMVLGLLGHVAGWPLAAGGSQSLADALAAYLRDLGGEIVTGTPVARMADLPPSRVVLCDTSPRLLLRLGGSRLPAGYRRQLRRYRYGPGAFKLDYALDGPIPWTAPTCALSATVHLGGTLDEIADAEDAVGAGRLPDRPLVLLVQPTLFDPGRAPAGKHIAWAYCHVPNGSTADMTARIEAQIERFAPGFRQRILARHVTTPADLQAYNPNYVGGDINGGMADWRQLFTRPAPRLNPYTTPVPGLYLCSSATPPGGGVHGMAGYWAAQAAIHDLLKGRV
jgi:phytoene dehydrogenase-like protein